jgi:hypothetical protein
MKNYELRIPVIARSFSVSVKNDVAIQVPETTGLLRSSQWRKPNYFRIMFCHQKEKQIRQLNKMQNLLLLTTLQF